MDIEVSTIIGTETKITWVRLKPNTADELSWDRAEARSLADGIAYLSRIRQAEHCL